MKLNTRERSARSTVIVSWWLSSMAWLTLGSPRAAAADVLLRFVNGREVVVREHWFAGSQVWFTHQRGAVGVPRTFVAAIETVGAQRGIGGGPRPVNAPTPLVAPESIR